MDGPCIVKVEALKNRDQSRNDDLALHDRRKVRGHHEQRYAAPRNCGCPAHERPVIWFSTRQDFEPTARKMRMPGRTILSVQEMRRYAGGVFRFGIDSTQAIPWKDLPEATYMASDTMLALASAGKRQGANPSDWFAVVGKLPLTSVAAIETMNEAGAWVSAEYQPVNE